MLHYPNLAEEAESESVQCRFDSCVEHHRTIYTQKPRDSGPERRMALFAIEKTPKKQMNISIIIVAVICVGMAIPNIALLLTGTSIGDKGRKTAIARNVLSIAEFPLLLIVSIIWFANDNNSKLYPIIIMLIGLLFLICGIIGLKNVLAERKDNLVTEHLTNIHVIPAGYRNLDRMLKGMVNGKESWFMLRGTDKAIAKLIKQNNVTEVTVTYHPSNRRIENIMF